MNSSYLMLLVGAYLALTNTRLDNISYNPADWRQFVREHDKQYETSSLEAMRRSIFAYNKHQIDQFNAEEANETGYELELNHLGDISQVEMRLRNGYRLPEEPEQVAKLLSNGPVASAFLESIFQSNSSVPEALDWRQSPGRVSPVKNQGQCGSCWAFASTGALEGQEANRKEGAKSNWTAANLIELSEQNLVDCVTKDAGCNGGIMQDAFEFVRDEGGIEDEQSYPYEGRTRKCRFQRQKVAFTDAGAALLPQGDEQRLKEAVARFGPVAVAIDASSLRFQFYRHGVYYNKHCHNKPDELDHAVLVVGYGTDPKKGDYWIVKNSWGPRYGEKGYIRMARNRGNNCGIASMATIPTF